VVGLYGLFTYVVTQRTREIGIRMALGADRGRVLSMILQKALFLMGPGIAIGLTSTFWASRFLHKFLYGVSEHDPWTLVLFPAILLLFGIFAVAIPARRAASVDPMQALRME
jgi:ABC-type antimicrobial peptide transport system permease subunit